MKNKLTTVLVLLLFTVAAYYIYDQLRIRSTEEKIAEISASIKEAGDIVDSLY